VNRAASHVAIGDNMIANMKSITKADLKELPAAAIAY
jgi:hypothetical protein